MNVLVLNCGSSSLKFQVIATDPERIRQNQDERLCRGQIEWIGAEAIVTIRRQDGEGQKFTASLRDMASALEYLLRWISSDESGVRQISGPADIDAVGHRVVHGGELFSESTVITAAVLHGIEDCIDLAPLHNPNNIRGIQAAQKVFEPGVPQVAVFDTSFHQTLPEHAYLYAVPYHWYKSHHVRRFGFHGTSHRFVAERYAALRQLSREEVHLISMHPGNGCSAAAIRGGVSVDTSMGMTPLEGLMMGTRCGDIDPAIINFIAAKEGRPAQEVETILNTQSGLLGISGLTNDMRVLLRELKDHDDRRIPLAIEVFCYRARKYIGAFLAAMGGADAIVFTGGIGENSPEVRARICDGLEWAGLRLDRNSNQNLVGAEGQISTGDSMLHAFVVPMDEELLIARDTVHCVLAKRPQPQTESSLKLEEVL